MRGSGAGLSDTALAGSSEAEGEFTAESSILIVGARGLVWVRLGGSVPPPSGVDEDMAAFPTALLLLPNNPLYASQSCLEELSIRSVGPKGVMGSCSQSQLGRQKERTAKIKPVVRIMSNDW